MKIRVSLRSSSWGNLSLFEITRASVLFSRKFQRQFNISQKWSFSDCDVHHIFQSENFRLIFSTKNSLTQEVKSEKLNFRNPQAIYQISFSKLCMNKIFSRPQVVQKSRQYLLLQTDILKKIVVGCPCLDHTLRTKKAALVS